MAEAIPKDVSGLLSEALNENFENFEITQFNGNEKGQGYMGDIYFISMRKKETNKEYHFVMKQALNNSTKDAQDIVSITFAIEILLYSKIFPSFAAFQKLYPQVKNFENVPQYYGCSTKEGKEKILLENLKFKNYEMHPREVPLTMKMYEEIFKLYGKYHGLSYAIQKYQPEKFLEVTGNLKNGFSKLINTDMCVKSFESICRKTYKILLEEGEEKIANKFKKYVDNCMDLYWESVLYKSPYAVITHGDTWSNNLMFKYNEAREIVDIKLLDFQMSLLASPVLDLTYSLFSGAEKATLDNYEKLLTIYHNSLKSALEGYGLDCAGIFPYEALKNEWKNNFAFGLIMSLMIWAIKTSDPNQGPNISDVLDMKTDATDLFKPDHQKFKKATIGLLTHLYENNIL